VAGTVRFEIVTKRLPFYDIDKNVKKSLGFRRIKYRDGRPPCAVVGGGMSTKDKVEELRIFEGDIYAINDVGKFLSDNGIPSILFAIDSTWHPFEVGPLVKGALLSSMCNRKQFNLFDKKNIEVFDQLGDEQWYMYGPTAATHAAWVLLKMGYKEIYYYGCDSSFAKSETHVYGRQGQAMTERLVVLAGGEEYQTNTYLLPQTIFLNEQIKKYPNNLFDRSGGLLTATRNDPDGWGVVAATEDVLQKLRMKERVVYESVGGRI
jgi:hypothetical protein